MLECYLPDVPITTVAVSETNMGRPLVQFQRLQHKMEVVSMFIRSLAKDDLTPTLVLIR